MKQENDETFRVVDRRLFNSEGELRDDAREQIEHERKEQQAKPSQAVPGKQPVDGASQSTTPAPEPPKRSPAFEMLIDLAARNAVAMLGGIADPRTGQPMLDLEGAREVIDMLDALRDKTRGNLTQDEEHLLLEVIGSLKMTYLEMSKAAATASVPGRENVRGKR
jgi:hypothetical protein